MSKQDKIAHLKVQVKELTEEMYRYKAGYSELQIILNKAFNCKFDNPVAFVRDNRRQYWNLQQDYYNLKQEYKTAARLAWSFGILCIVLLAALVFSK